MKQTQCQDEATGTERLSKRYFRIAKEYINTNLKQWSEILRNEYVYRTETF